MMVMMVMLNSQRHSARPDGKCWRRQARDDRAVATTESSTSAAVRSALRLMPAASPSTQAPPNARCVICWVVASSSRTAPVVGRLMSTRGCGVPGEGAMRLSILSPLSRPRTPSSVHRRAAILGESLIGEDTMGPVKRGFSRHCVMENT